MGSCYYYLLAEWPNEAGAKKAYPEVLRVLRDIVQANDYTGFSRLLTKYRFPEGDCPSVPVLNEHGEGEDGQNLEQAGPFISLYGEVSHLTSWEPLVEFMKIMGALEVAWISEEDFDFFEYLHLLIKEPEFQRGG